MAKRTPGTSWWSLSLLTRGSAELRDEWWNDLHVFARDRTKEDELLPGMAERYLPPDHERAPLESRLGDPLLELSRLVATNLGPHGRLMYAVPTMRRRLCVFLTGGETSCAGGMSDGVLLSAHGDGRGALSLWGLLEDDVVGVTFQVDGRTLEAVTGPNWFFLEEHDPKLATARPQSMLLTLTTDGGTREIPLTAST